MQPRSKVVQCREFYCYWVASLDFSFLGNQGVVHKKHNNLNFLQRGQQQPRETVPILTAIRSHISANLLQKPTNSRKSEKVLVLLMIKAFHSVHSARWHVLRGVYILWMPMRDRKRCNSSVFLPRLWINHWNLVNRRGLRKHPEISWSFKVHQDVFAVSWSESSRHRAYSRRAFPQEARAHPLKGNPHLLCRSLPLDPA